MFKFEDYLAVVNYMGATFRLSSNLGSATREMCDLGKFPNVTVAQFLHL